MVVVLGFCPSLGVPLGDRLSSGDEALDVAEKVAGKVGVCDHFNDARGGHFKEAFFANIITNVPSATFQVMV